MKILCDSKLLLLSLGMIFWPQFLSQLGQKVLKTVQIWAIMYNLKANKPSNIICLWRSWYELQIKPKWTLGEIVLPKDCHFYFTYIIFGGFLHYMQPHAGKCKVLLCYILTILSFAWEILTFSPIATAYWMVNLHLVNLYYYVNVFIFSSYYMTQTQNSWTRQTINGSMMDFSMVHVNGHCKWKG